MRLHGDRPCDLAFESKADPGKKREAAKKSVVKSFSIPHTPKASVIDRSGKQQNAFIFLIELPGKFRFFPGLRLPDSLIAGPQVGEGVDLVKLDRKSVV